MERPQRLNYTPVAADEISDAVVNRVFVFFLQ
jgi:hypothetical protein